MYTYGKNEKENTLSVIYKNLLFFINNFKNIYKIIRF